MFILFVSLMRFGIGHFTLFSTRVSSPLYSFACTFHPIFQAHTYIVYHLVACLLVLTLSVYFWSQFVSLIVSTCRAVPVDTFWPVTRCLNSCNPVCADICPYLGNRSHFFDRDRRFAMPIGISICSVAARTTSLFHTSSPSRFLHTSCHFCDALFVRKWSLTLCPRPTCTTTNETSLCIPCLLWIEPCIC